MEPLFSMVKKFRVLKIYESYKLLFLSMGRSTTHVNLCQRHFPALQMRNLHKIYYYICSHVPRNIIFPWLPLLIFSINRKWTIFTTRFPKLKQVTCDRGTRKKLYFGQWQYITKMIQPMPFACSNRISAG